MPEIYPDDPPTFQVDHEVGQMPVPYPQDILAHGEGGEGAEEVGAKDEEGFRGGGQVEEGAP